MKLFGSLIVITLAMTFVACAKKTTKTTDAASGTPAIPCAGKIIFTAPVSNGAFGGKSGADAVCNANKPTGFSSSTFKAMLGDVAGGRRACYVSGNDTCYTSTTGRMDWVFSANQTYCSADYVRTLGTSDTHALLSPDVALSSTAQSAFTGFNIAWGVSVSNNCSDFSSTGGAQATAGLATGTGQNFYAGGFLSCGSAGYVMCVEQ